VICRFRSRIAHIREEVNIFITGQAAIASAGSGISKFPLAK